MDREAADEDVHGCQLSENANLRGIDADFLERFPQRRFDKRFAGIRRAAGQADLSGVPGQSTRPDRQGYRDVTLARVDQQQGSGRSGILGKVAGLPSGARRRRREPQLSLQSRQRARQPLAK